LEGALFPSAEGTEQKNSVSLWAPLRPCQRLPSGSTGDELKLAGGTGTVWRRAK